MQCVLFEVKKELFCHPCREAFQREIHSHKMRLHLSHRSFVSEGFCDWKNAKARFKVHELSKIHSDSIYIINQKTKPTVAGQLISSIKRQHEQRRNALSIRDARGS